MNYQDPRGVALTASSQMTIDQFENVIDDYLSLCNDPEASLDALLQDDPDFVMGHCLKASFNLLAMERATMPIVAALIKKLDSLWNKATDAERLHIGAIRLWMAGDLHQAAAVWEEALLLNPRDILALRLRHELAFFLGDCRNLRDGLSRVRSQWDDKTPGYGYLLGMYAFGLEECGDYEKALDIGYQALTINPKDSWGVHALAHVYEMQGKQAEGINLLTSRQHDWATDNFFAVHNWWHLAMYHLDLEQYDRVFNLYDGPIRNDQSNAILDLVDGASMLWRLYLLGKDVGTKRWEEITDAWMTYSEDGIYSFNDVHIMMGLAAIGRYEEAEALIAFMEKIATGPNSTNKLATITVGLPACRGLLAFAKGQYDEAIGHLLPIRYKAFHFGGSHAQRDLLSWTVIEALLRADQHQQARAVVNERLELKPTSLQSHKMAIRANQSLGDITAVDEHNKQIQALLAGL